MSPPGSHEAAAASGNGACSDADQLDGRGSAENRDDGEKEEEREEVLPQRRRRKRRAPFKRLGSVGRPLYRAKVVKDPFECYRCHAKYTTKRGLEYHLRTHSGAPLLPCDFCPLEFPSGRMLSSHCARKHGRPSLSRLAECHH